MAIVYEKYPNTVMAFKILRQYHLTSINMVADWLQAEAASVSISFRSESSINRSLTIELTSSPLLMRRLVMMMILLSFSKCTTSAAQFGLQE